MNLVDKVFKCFFVFIILLVPVTAEAQQLQSVLSWIDLPYGSIESYITISIDGLKNANQMIVDYHKINKDQITTLALRIRKLQLIAAELNRIQSRYNFRSDLASLKYLAATAIKKSRYLQALSDVYRHNKHSPQNLYTYHVDSANLEGGDHPLYLVNKLLYDAKMPTFWGYYWLETLDPCHRQLTDYYLKWLSANRDVPFFLWLETQDIPYYTPSIYYYTDAELMQLMTKIKDGLLYDAQGNLLDLSEANKAYLFVVTLDKRLYITEGSLKIRHTSITHGKPVLGSGEIKIQKGVISYWSTESGHYQPTLKDAQQIAALFDELHLKLHQDCRVMYYSANEKNIVSCSQMKNKTTYDLDPPKTLNFDTLHNLL